MVRRPLLLGLPLVLLLLGSCTSLYQYPGDRSQVAYKTSAVHIETIFAPEKFFLRLGRNLPGYQEPAAPSPDDLFVVESFVATHDFAGWENLLSSLFKHHVVTYEGTGRSDGNQWPLFVRADVFDHSGKVWDPKTNQEVQEPEYTKTDFAFLEARSGDVTVFQRPGPLEDEAVFPFRLVESKDWGVYLTTLVTNLDAEEQVKAVHGLWANLKLPEQQFEIRDDQGRVVAWFDNQVLSVADDPKVDKARVKTLAASILAFQALARAYHLDNTVSSRRGSAPIVPSHGEEYPIVF